MKRSSLLSITALSFAAAAACAEDYDGSKPMVCEAINGHDCLPAETACKPLKPQEPKQGGGDVYLHFDVGKMTVRTPYRNDTLPIQAFSNNTKSLVLQGTTLELVWSATIHRTTGRLTIVIADREGAYVVFGQCKLEGARPAAP